MLCGRPPSCQNSFFSLVTGVSARYMYPFLLDQVVVVSATVASDVGVMLFLRSSPSDDCDSGLVISFFSQAFGTHSRSILNTKTQGVLSLVGSAVCVSVRDE